MLGKNQTDLNAKKRKHNNDTEKKRQTVEFRYCNIKESIKQYKKDMRKKEHQILLVRKQGIKEILKCNCYLKIVDTTKI